MSKLSTLFSADDLYASSINRSKGIFLKSPAFEELITNIYFVILVTFVSSLLVGTVFYYVVHKWELSTSFYYASQVLLGNMYGIPQERQVFSEAFTMLYFLWGTSLIAVFHLLASSNYVPSSQGNSFRQLLSYIVTQQKTKEFAVMLALVWIGLGTMYGIVAEGLGFFQSLYFAVGAMSAAGVPSPKCVDGDDMFPLESCRLGTLRALALGIYLIIGVPLFAVTIGLLSSHVINSVIRANQRRILAQGILQQPLTAPLSESPVSDGAKIDAERLARGTRPAAAVYGGRDNSGARSVSAVDELDFVVASLVHFGRTTGDEVRSLRRAFRSASLPGSPASSDLGEEEEEEEVERGGRRLGRSNSMSLTVTHAICGQPLCSVCLCTREPSLALPARWRRVLWASASMALALLLLLVALEISNALTVSSLFAHASPARGKQEISAPL